MRRLPARDGGVIAARGLSRRFGGRTVVEAVSFSVGPGEVVGFLGPNGAGKTTTIRLMLGLLWPTSGSVSAFGLPPGPAAMARVGYVPGDLGFYEQMTGAALLDHLAGLQRELRSPQLHSILSTYDVLGGPATLNVIWTVARFHDEHPKTYRVFVESLEEAIDLLNRDKRAAAATYKRLTNDSESVEAITAMLEDPRLAFTLTPHRVLRTAEFMHRIGRVKHRPASWKDLFFENVHGRDGS